MARSTVPKTCTVCGAVRFVPPSMMRAYKTSLCKRCTLTTRNKARAKHGLERHPLYAMWANMLRRLANPVGKSRTYAGLDIDPAWAADVQVFYGWAIEAGWKPGLSIERRDNSRGYWPDNCCFIPLVHQARHRNNNSIMPAIANLVKARVAFGENRYRTAKSIAAEYSIPLSTVIKVAYGYNWK